MLYIKLFIEREKNIGQSAPECPFKGIKCEVEPSTPPPILAAVAGSQQLSMLC